MKKPLNTRQQRFCEFIAAGETQTNAYLKAGFKVPRTDARKHAARLMTNDDIAARIAVLRKPQTKNALRTKDENLRYLAAVIGTPLRDIGPDSPLCVEYTETFIVSGSRGKLKRGEAPSGNETTGETVIRRKIKKPDPLRAIEIYSRLCGHFEPDRVEVEAAPQALMSIKEQRFQRINGL
jgi:hypothetical protein